MNPNLTNPTNNGQGDYGSNQDYLKKVDHDADMVDVRKRLDAIEARVKDNAALAASFNEAFKNDRNMDATLCEVMAKHVLKDDTVKTTVKEIVDDTDRDWLKSHLKKIGFAAWTLLIALVSGGVVALWLTSHH
jgi:hypothetical protein